MDRKSVIVAKEAKLKARSKSASRTFASTLAIGTGLFGVAFFMPQTNVHTIELASEFILSAAGVLVGGIGVTSFLAWRNMGLMREIQTLIVEDAVADMAKPARAGDK